MVKGNDASMKLKEIAFALNGIFDFFKCTINSPATLKYTSAFKSYYGVPFGPVNQFVIHGILL